MVVIIYVCIKYAYKTNEYILYIYINIMNHAYDEFIRRHDTAEERISVFNDGSKKLPKMKCEEEKNKKKENTHARTVGNFQKV